MQCAITNIIRKFQILRDPTKGIKEHTLCNMITRNCDFFNLAPWCIWVVLDNFELPESFKKESSASYCGKHTVKSEARYIQALHIGI